MQKPNIFVSFLGAIFLSGILSCCGGGGGGGSTNEPTIPSNNGFTATADNSIEGGQKEFAFGQTATFGAKDITGETWSTASGTINSAGQYITPTDLSVIEEDTVTMSAAGDVDTRTITVSPFPAFNGTYFKYSDGNQSYYIPNLNSTEAIGVATFQNDSTNSGEGDIKIKNFTPTSEVKKEPFVSSNMKKLQETDARYRAPKRNNYSAPLKYSKKKGKTAKVKNNRSADPLGTRETFFHDEGVTPGHKTFEKIYSGSKCLIYSEVNTSNDTAYVSQTRGKEIGDSFEVSNSFHPEGTPIFDVVTTTFGNPWGISSSGEEINDGGRDGEKQVLFLLYKDTSSGTYGYFYWVDEEEKGFIDPSSNYESNGAEIVYINQFYANDDIAVLSTMAHEFQHLCDYNQKFVLDGNYTDRIYDESFDQAVPTLFNEGQSVLSEDLNGFSLQMSGNKGNDFLFDVCDDYMATISTASISFFTFNSGSDYGKGYLFWRFLYDTYGESTVIEATHSPLIQPENIESATGKKMDVLLQEFLLAIMQTESERKINSKIKISTIDKTITYFGTTGKSKGTFQPLDYVSGFPGKIISSENPYAIKLYKISPTSNGGNLEVGFTLENIKKLSSYSIFTAIIDK